MARSRRRGTARVILVLGTAFAALATSEAVVRSLPVANVLGWQQATPIQTRVAEFDSGTPVKIVALGDSFAEWRAGQGANMFDHAKAGLSGRHAALLNLGQSGTDVDQYIAAYHRYVRFVPDQIVLLLYLGNDVHVYSPGQPSQAIPEPTWRETIKRYTVLPNLIFRAGKRYVPFLRSGFFERNVTVVQRETGLSDNQIQERIRRIDPQILELARADAVNPWIPAIGIAFPEYYKDLLGLRTAAAKRAADSTVTLIQAFAAEVKVSRFNVVFLPESLQASTAFDDFFTRCGFDLEGFPLEDRNRLTEYLEIKLRQAGLNTIDTMPALRQEGGGYLPLDTHLNARGHEVVGEMIVRALEES